MRVEAEAWRTCRGSAACTSEAGHPTGPSPAQLESVGGMGGRERERERKREKDREKEEGGIRRQKQ